MRRKIAFAGMLAAALAMLAGCGQLGRKGAGAEQSRETENLQERLITVGFSQLGSESVWRSANSVSIQDTMTEENGYYLIYENARQKQENQIKAIRSFISQRVDYIVFAPVVETGWDTVLEEARQAGIPVITSDRQVVVKDPSLVAAWVGGDMVEEGRKAGIWLKENTDEQETLNIAVLTGTEGSSAALGRSKGFHEISDTMDNWTILEEKSADFTIARGREVMAYFLDTYPQINVLVSQNDDMTFGAIEVMKERGLVPGKDIRIISFDAVTKALEMVADGQINVDVECSPLLGPYIDQLIKRMESGEKVPAENPVDELVFTIDNAAQYLDQRTY